MTLKQPRTENAIAWFGYSVVLIGSALLVKLLLP
jgi:hypothetical protein